MDILMWLVKPHMQVYQGHALTVLGLEFHQGLAVLFFF